MSRIRFLFLVIGLSTAMFIGCGDDDDDGTEPPPGIEFPEQKEIAEATVSRYQELLETGSPQEARQTLAQELRAMEDVEAAGVSVDSITVWWTLHNGYEYCLLTETRASLTDTTSGGLLGRREPPTAPSGPHGWYSLAGFPHNNSALILSPYQWDWNLLDLIPMEDETPFINDASSSQGYETTFKVNDDKNDQNISMNDYKDFDDYGVIAISTHGGVNSESQVFICMGVIATEELVLEYSQDIINGNLVFVVYIDKWFTDDDILAFAFTPGWVHTYYPQRLDSTLFYASSCKGLFNNTMADAIVGSGSAYFSWDESVGMPQAATTGRDLFTQLVYNAHNCGEAFQIVLENGNGTFSPPFWSSEPDAHFGMRGDEELRLVEEPLRIAVTPQYYDDIGAILIEFGYDVTTVALADLLNPSVVDTCDVIGINCAPSLGEYANNAAPILRDFVSNGGRLYTSDWAFAFVEAAFPEYVEFLPYVGHVQTVTASIVDDELAEYLGITEAEIVYDLSSWVVVDGVSASANVLVEGEVDFSTLDGHSGSEPSHRRPEYLAMDSNLDGALKPLAISFEYGEGIVVYTTFHNEAQVSEAIKHILEYFTILER